MISRDCNEQQETKTKETKSNQINLGQFIGYLEDQLPSDIKDHNQPFGMEAKLTLYWCCIKILRIAKPQPRYFDEIDKQNAKSLRDRGCSMQEIAFVLGRSKSSVCEYLKQEE